MVDRVVSYVFKGNFSNLTAGLSVAAKATQDYAGKLAAVDKQGAKMRAGLTQVGDTAGKIGLAAGVGLAAVIGVTAKFDKAMSAVQAATHESASNMDQLRQAAVKAGAETVYSASESAGAIEELAKAGVSTRDILNGGLTGSLNLAAAGGIDVADAAETAATALTQFRLSGSQVPHVADLLAAGAGKAQGSVGDLGMALKQSGLVASQFGLSIDETVGTLASFASAGLIGSDAGTSFKQSLLQLASPSVKSAKLMASLGIAAYDAGGKFVGMANLAGQLQAALKDKTQAERDSALATIFGSDAIRVANVLYQQGAGGIQSWIDKTNDSGYAAKTASTRLDNLSGDLEQLKGSLETALIGAGEGAQGPLRELVQGATAAVNAFNKLPGPLKSTATAALALTAVFGGGLWFTAKTLNGIVAMRSNLSTLGVSATGASRAMKGIGIAAGVAVGVETLFAAVDQLNKALDENLPGANTLESRIISLADGKVGSLGSEFDSLSSSISRVADGRWDDGLSSFFNALLPGDTRARSLRDATAEIDLLDQSLAQLVTEGHADVAAAALDKLNLSGEQLGKLRPLLTQYNEAVAGASNSTKLATDSVGDFGVGANKAAQDAAELADAMRKQREDARGVAASFVDLGSSLDDTKSSLSSWIGQMEKQAQALRDFTKNAQIAGKRGLRDGLIAELEAAGPAGATRLKQLADASDSEIGRANRAWAKGQAAIRAYVNMKVPTKKADVDVSQAQAALSSLKAYLDSLHDRNIHVNVATSHTNATIGELAANQHGHGADGTTVPKTGLPYADRHPYLLADGERVTSNRHGQADKSTRLLDMINQGRLSDRMVGLADGGTAGATWRGGRVTNHVASVDALASSLDGKRAWDGWTRSELHAIAAAQKAATVLGTLHGVSLKVIQAQTAQAAAQIKGAKTNEAQTKVLDRLKGTTLKQAKAFDDAVKKQVAREKEAVDVETAHKKAILDDMAAVKESIASRFRSDVFGGVDSSSIAYKIDPKSGKYVDKAQSSILQSQAVLAGLQKDIAGAKASKAAAASIQAELKGSGLTKDQISNAILYAQQNASVEQLQALAGNKSLATQYASLYGQRQAVTDTTGQAAANMVFGQELKTTNTHLAALSADYKEGLRKQHQSNVHLNELEKRMKNLEALAKSNPEATGKSAGKHVGDAINNAAKGR